MLLSPAPVAAAITFNGAVTNQVIDGFGVNVNSRSWKGTELQPVLDAFIDEAGMTLFRVVFELSNWETNNDNADPDVMNWAYYNTVYGSTDFTRLWDMVAYLNGRGITNDAYLSFMGWGPAWMMDTDGRTLRAGMEREWAEMIASAAIYARNSRGLQFGLLAPNNEPDIYNEGIHMGPWTYTNALHQLVLTLDTNGMTGLDLIGPDCSSGVAPSTYMSPMTRDPVVMGRLRRFGVHSYSDGGGGSAGVLSFILGSPYPDRTFWMTEFNVWCSGCDSGSPGTFDWTYTRGTADYLLHHLLNGASAGLVWEGYDSVYAHHGYAWSYWGLFGVDNPNAPVKTYTPRKHFYTVAQISKWVRPGARRIGVSGSTSPFSPLLAFHHAGLGQITIVGINTSSSAAVLNGSLVSLPVVPSLDLYYTSATTNLAPGGAVTVNNGSFSASIPSNCVFTLTGFAGLTLTNGVPYTNSNSDPAPRVDYYRYAATNLVARLQFEVNNPATVLTLLARRGGLPEPDLGLFDYESANPGTNDQFILVLTNSSPVGASPGDWFLAAVNNSNQSGGYVIEANQWDESGEPITLAQPDIESNSFCLSWNSLPGAHYVVQAKSQLPDSIWANASGTLTATNTVSEYCVPLPSSYRFFRIAPGVAVGNSEPSIAAPGYPLAPQTR